MFKKLLTALAVAGVSSSALAQTGNPTGNMQLTVEVPEVLVLYHWDRAHINLTNDNNRAIVDSHGTGSADISATSVEVEGQLEAINSVSSTNLIEVTLKDSWAVRSITENGKFKLKIEDTDHILLKDGSDSASQISIRNSSLSSDTAEGVSISGQEFTADSQWNPVKGDIKFNLDLSELKRSGEHTSSNNTFTLTLSKGD